MTVYHACPVIIPNRWLARRPTSWEAVLLARLVKAEIVSPYCGILINTGVGNPTVPFARPLGTGEFKASGEAFDIRGLYKGGKDSLFSPTPFLSLSPSVPELQRPSFSFSLVRESTPMMSGSRARGKWMALSVKKKDIKELREAGYLAKEIIY